MGQELNSCDTTQIDVITSARFTRHHACPCLLYTSQAQEYGHSLERELCYLAVHSVLHLLGYDHMDEGPMKDQMRAREEAILGKLGITRE